MARRTDSTASADDVAGESAPGESAGASTETGEPTSGPGDPGMATAAGESPFFVWIRCLDLRRRPGWLGGVCAGIAHRFGLDPVIVRGIVVVIGVLGGPVALLYALGWFLLPDERGEIHAQELVRGRMTRALSGIVVVFLLSFLPLAQGFWFAGSFYWGDLGWGGVALRIAWTGVLIAAALVAVVWLAQRSAAPRAAATGDTASTADGGAASTVASGPVAADGTQATPSSSATEVPTASPVTRPEPSAGGAAASAFMAPATTLTEPGEPTPPPAEADAEELAAWKASQDEWQRQRALWVAEQKRTDLERRRGAARARALAAAEVRRERKRLRRARPRASGGVVGLIAGLALVTAAISAWIAQAGPETQGAEWMIGAGVLTLVLGVGIVIVGLMRRRSGALSLLGIAAVLLLAVAVAYPNGRQMLPIGSWYSLDRDHDGRYVQLAGDTEIMVFDRTSGRVPTIDLRQYAGAVHVEVDPAAAVRLEFDTASPTQAANGLLYRPDGSVEVWEPSSAGRGTATYGEGETDLVLHLWLGGGAGIDVSMRSAEVTEPEGAVS